MTTPTAANEDWQGTGEPLLGCSAVVSRHRGVGTEHASSIQRCQVSRVSQVHGADSGQCHSWGYAPSDLDERAVLVEGVRAAGYAAVQDVVLCTRFVNKLLVFLSTDAECGMRNDGCVRKALARA
jgi:hypothetical protein